MAFHFRLEKVARHRQRLVDEQGTAVAAADRTVRAVVARLFSVDEDLSRQLQTSGTPDGGGLSVQDLITRARWVTHLEGVRRATAVELESAQHALALEQELLQRRWRDVEVLKKLRAQQRNEWREVQKTREHKMFDEIGQIRADRQRRSKIAT